MAKKADNKKLFFLIALALGVVALVLYLVPMLKFRVDVDILGVKGYNEVKFNGFNLMFGAKEVKGITYNNITGNTTEYAYEKSEIKMAVGVLISAILTIVGLVVAVLGKFVGKKNASIFKFVAFGAFVAAAILVMVLTKSTYISANEIPESAAEYYHLAIGSYLICAANGLAGVGVLLS